MFDGTILSMARNKWTIAERVERIQRKYYPDMTKNQLIDLLAFWWKVEPASIYHAVETNAVSL